MKKQTLWPQKWRDNNKVERDNLMVWSKEALSSWLLSFEKQTDVTPLLWARSKRRRHWPVKIFHTYAVHQCKQIAHCNTTNVP